MEAPTPTTPTTPTPTAESATADAIHQERMEYIRQLVQERENLASNANCDVAKRLIEQELERVQSGRRSEEKRAVEVTKEKSIKVTVKVLVPVREHPKFNFVGKLLGPKGNSLKRLQEETMTKMAILGKGSFRDKGKEEELRRNPDPKYSHLQEDLHVEVTAHAPPAEAYARIAYALTEIRRYLVPDHNDEIRQEQMREMQVLSGGRTGAGGLGCEPGDGQHTESTGSLSPPSSLSPPPPGPVKLPTPHQLVAHAHAHAHAQPQVHPSPAAHLLAATHPAMRGLTRTQMGLLSAVPTGLPGPAAVPGAIMNRFPAILPLGSVTPMPPHPPRRPFEVMGKTREEVMFGSGQTTTTTTTTTPLPPAPFLTPDYLGYNLTMGLPVYEEYSDVTTTLQADYDGAMVTEDKKEGGVFKSNTQIARGKFRHEPYRRLPLNVPS